MIGIPSKNDAPWRILLGLLIAIGLLSRLAPFLDHGGRLLRQFPTEDGYLSLQIARNMALGLGMTVSEGTIPTNGTQPFCTFVWSICYRLADCDKTTGVAFVLIFQIMVAAISSYLLYRFGCLVLRDIPWSERISSLAACTWFASTVAVQHTMNCLETGTYVLAVLVATILFVRNVDRYGGSWSVKDNLVMGLILGWAFWVRNDAVFLILAACLTKVILGRSSSIIKGFGEACVMGATSVVVAAPWLYSNYVRFERIMPISGHSQSYGAAFGNNARLVPHTVAEYFVSIAPIPESVEDIPSLFPIVMWGSLVLLAAIGIALANAYRRDTVTGRVRTTLTLVGIYAAGLCIYYGVLFGAPHFLNRYLFSHLAIHVIDMGSHRALSLAANQRTMASSVCLWRSNRHASGNHHVAGSILFAR